MLFLGIDLGTSYFKLALFDSVGTLRGLGRVAVRKDTPHEGEVELPVDRFWALLREGLGAALAEAGASATDIAGVSYSSQANSFVLLDAAGEALTPFILWTDTRAGAVPAPYAAFAATPLYADAVGAVGLAVEQAVVKWHWWREHQRRIWARVRWQLTISDYLAFALTGQPCGDASTAALLGLYHLAEGRWWDEALRVFEVEVHRLAALRAPGAAVGPVSEAGAARLGLRAGTPFAVGALDHHAAAIGSGLGAFADASLSTGTVLAALCSVDRVQPMSRCYHGPGVGEARFYRLAFDPAGAGQLEQFQQRYAPDHAIGDLIAEAAALAPGAHPAAPMWSPEWGCDRPAAVRHLLERIARQQGRLLATVSDGRPLRRVSVTGGGARSPEWLTMTADILGLPVVTAACPERACLGGAIFAAAAVGAYPSVEAAAAAMVHIHREFPPDAGRVAAYRAVEDPR